MPDTYQDLLFLGFQEVTHLSNVMFGFIQVLKGFSKVGCLHVQLILGFVIVLAGKRPSCVLQTYSLLQTCPNALLTYVEDLLRYLSLEAVCSVWLHCQ